MDAPRAFSMKLGLITRGNYKLLPSKVDPELCLRHDNGVLTCIMTKHVDDLKLAGKPEIVREVLKELQAVFG